VDGVAYAWDANGNLLSDGSRTFTYDHANRLSSITQGSDVYSFSYNGLGDRLQQTVNGVASDYTLDLVIGLIQVLSDGEEAFLYGVSRVAQQGFGDRQYFLGDALNSTRQLVDDAGQPGLGNAYEPFGDLLSVAGEFETSYGFAGEWTDDTGLIHLRARYYQPTDGRFVHPDPSAGVPTQPISQNPYPYAYDNPLIYTDASGRNPLLAAIISGAALGGIIGVVGGGVFARLTYDWSIRGDCGCEMQLWALSVNGTKWIAKATLLAGAIGFIAGGLAAAAPIGEIVVGLVGYAYATYDLSVLMLKVYTRWQATSEFGFTRCELLRFVVDVVGMIGGALLASKGFVGRQQSGSLWRWGAAKPTVPLNSKDVPYPDVDVPGYGKVEFPDGPYSPNNSAARPAEFTQAFKNAFKTWWTDQGRPWPQGRIEIHHIKPLQFGGENVFENLVPLPWEVHRLFTSWWSGFKP
jgi:RHS repeat-associated protein